MFHQLVVDCPGGLEFLGRAAQVLAGLKELLVKLWSQALATADGGA